MRYEHVATRQGELLWTPRVLAVRQEAVGLCSRHMRRLPRVTLLIQSCAPPQTSGSCTAADRCSVAHQAALIHTHPSQQHDVSHCHNLTIDASGPTFNQRLCAKAAEEASVVRDCMHSRADATASAAIAACVQLDKHTTKHTRARAAHLVFHRPNQHAAKCPLAHLCTLLMAGWELCCERH